MSWKELWVDVLSESGAVDTTRLARGGTPMKIDSVGAIEVEPGPVSYTHLTLPTILLV